jgi:four helix bundle protein
VAWQKGKELTILLYKLLKNNRYFCFKDRILRAVVSICNNIAEDFERQTNKEMKQFFFIAKGSICEVRSILYPALELQYVNKAEFDHVYNLTMEIGKLLSAS